MIRTHILAHYLDIEESIRLSLCIFCWLLALLTEDRRRESLGQHLQAGHFLVAYLLGIMPKVLLERRYDLRSRSSELKSYTQSSKALSLAPFLNELKQHKTLLPQSWRMVFSCIGILAALAKGGIAEAGNQVSKNKLSLPEVQPSPFPYLDTFCQVCMKHRKPLCLHRRGLGILFYDLGSNLIKGRF